MNNSETINCPVCNDAVHKLLYRFHIDSERAVLERIKKEHPSWAKNDGICSRCVDYFHSQVVKEQRLLPDAGPFFLIKSPDDYIIIPTPLRLDADPQFTGKGVTICFIDSGFYPHPDITATRNRIKAMIDIADDANADYKGDASGAAWHGTMTTVVCAGDGFLSNGLYRGIASDAELVLLKVQDSHGKITDANIINALEWVLQHHAAYNIKIVNISLGADVVESYTVSKIDMLAEQLIDAGITVVAAAGNDENALIKPPANSLRVIAVGGIDDGNELNSNIAAYHSSFGKTEDGLMKPELVANAIWIAAPILPGVAEHTEAKQLHASLESNDDALISSIHDLYFLQQENFQSHDAAAIRARIVQRIQQTKYFSPHYMHVDGTSFAAPIVCSLIAQLLECNPSLTPANIRQILFSTAMKLSSLPIERQGFGYVHPRKAILKIIKHKTIMKKNASPYVNHRKKTIEFYIHNECAQQISLAGSFNHWAQDVLLMQPGRNGLWKIEIPMLQPGTYRYKFFIDDKMWMEDVENPWREPDGFIGWNSVLQVN